MLFKQHAKRIEAIVNLSNDEILQSLDKLETCLTELEKSVKQVNKQRRSGLGLFGGAELDSYATVLRKRLQEIADSSLLPYQVRAVDISGHIIAKHFGHYHHMVGPITIAKAELLAKMDRIEESNRLYSAVVKDFLSILERIEDIDFTLDQEDENMIALKSLEIAVKRLEQQGEIHGENADIPVLSKRIAEFRNRQRQLATC